MFVADFTMKEGDLSPDLQVTLKDAADAAVDVTEATSVKFYLRKKHGAVVVNGADATVVTPASGVVKYVWQAGDSDTPGQYEGEFRVVFSGGAPETFPNASYIDILILDALSS